MGATSTWCSSPLMNTSERNDQIHDQALSPGNPGAHPDHILLFFMMHAQGNPADRFAQNPKVTTAQIAAFEHRWASTSRFRSNTATGWAYVATKARSTCCLLRSGRRQRILHGDLGYSTYDGLPVVRYHCPASPAHHHSHGHAYIIWLTLAILLGVYAAVKRYSLFDSG